MIASKTRSFFLGLCVNLIIFLENFPQMQMQKKKTSTSSHTFFFGEQKIRIWPQFYLDFRGRGEGGIFILTSKVFGQVVQICRHLMLNPSWDAHIQPNITKLKKKTLFNNLA
jgi:hypothetical protein